MEGSTGGDVGGRPPAHPTRTLGAAPCLDSDAQGVEGERHCRGLVAKPRPHHGFRLQVPLVEREARGAVRQRVRTAAASGHAGWATAPLSPGEADAGVLYLKREVD